MQNKLLSNMRMVSKAQKSNLSGLTQDQKAEYLKGLVTDIFKEVNYSSIIIFNAVFEEGDMYKAVGNKPFYLIMNYVIEDLFLL